MQKSPIVVLDGAHNRAKMRSTAQNVRNTPHKTLHLVLGLNAKKDVRALLREIVPLAHRVYVTRFQTAGILCAEPRGLFVQARKYACRGAPMSVHLDPNDALDCALRAAKRDDLVLVTGSFYLAGDLRRRWYPEEWVLNNRKSRLGGAR